MNAINVTPQKSTSPPPLVPVDHDPKPLPGRRDLPLDLVVESPTNPRTYFDKDRLDELAQSIRAVGVKEDVLVRPVKATPEILAVLGEDQKGKIKLGQWVYELASGHRRRRASRMAGKDMIPAKVEHLTDAEMLELQLVAVEQHEDVQDMERARAYSRMLTQTADDGQRYTHAKIAQRIGKHASYVYRILQFNNLVQQAQEALLRRLITQSHAVELCRRQPADQYRIFMWMFGTRHRSPSEVLKDPDAVVKVSVRELRDFIARELNLDLSQAPFDPTDAKLVPEAGACAICSKRAGNQPDFTDVSKVNPKANPNVCTDKSCYDKKKEALVQLRLQQVQERQEENSPEPLTEAHQKQLKRILKSDDDKLWKKLRQQGAADQPLLQAISTVIGSSVGSSDSVSSVSCRGGTAPAVWFDQLLGKGEPSLQGKALIQAARVVLGIGTEPCDHSAVLKPKKHNGKPLPPPVKPEVLKVSNDYSYSSSAHSVRMRYKGVLFGDQYTVATPSCHKPISAVWVDGDKIGQETQICTDKSCRHGFVKQARNREEDTRLRTIRNKTQVQQQFRYQLASEVRAKFPAAIGPQETRLLSSHVIARLHDEDRKRLVKFMGWEPKKVTSNYRGTYTDYEATIQDQMQRMSNAELVKLMLTCTVLGDLGIPGYNPTEKLAADSRLRQAAAIYKVNADRVLSQVEQGAKEKREQSKQKEKKLKAKAAKGGR